MPVYAWFIVAKIFDSHFKSFSVVYYCFIVADLFSTHLFDQESLWASMCSPQVVSTAQHAMPDDEQRMVAGGVFEKCI